jgi:hypothetical protein
MNKKQAVVPGCALSLDALITYIELSVKSKAHLVDEVLNCIAHKPSEAPVWRSKIESALRHRNITAGENRKA